MELADSRTSALPRPASTCPSPEAFSPHLQQAAALRWQRDCPRRRSLRSGRDRAILSSLKVPALGVLTTLSTVIFPTQEAFCADAPCRIRRLGSGSKLRRRESGPSPQRPPWRAAIRSATSPVTSRPAPRPLAGRLRVRRSPAERESVRGHPVRGELAERAHL